jgi:hypothetical protein
MRRAAALSAMALVGLTSYARGAVEECVTNYSQTKDYFPAAAGTTVEEARKFTIDYFPHYKVVTNLASKRQYVLYPCGGPEPDVSALGLPVGYQRKTLSVPVKVNKYKCMINNKYMHGHVSMCVSM